MASKALRLLESGPAIAKKGKVESGKAFADLRQSVRLMGRDISLEAAARYWRLLDRRQKEVTAAMEMAKKVLRSAAQGEMEKCGGYVSSVVIGPARVSRQNRFKPVRFSKDDIVEAIGKTEFRSMFSESAAIEFNDIDTMRQYLKRADLAGVHCEGVPVEQVKAKSSIRERMAELGDALSEDKVALLEACAEDAALTVGHERRRA